VADLTRLLVAAQTAKRPRPEPSVPVGAMELRNVKDIAAGSLNTYA
jgi:hypothetical protein